MTEGAEQPSQVADALLQKFVMAEHSDDAQVYLDQLLSNHALPLIIQVIGRKLNSAQIHGIRDEHQDGEDICQEVLFQLLRRLRDLREAKESSAITSFSGYVVTTAQNGYYHYLRTKHPTRWRFKNRIRYLLNHRAEFETWQNESGEFMCGLRGWRFILPLADVFSEQVAGFTSAESVKINQARDNPAQLSQLFLARLGHPIAIDHLVKIVAELSGVLESQEISSGNAEENVFCELLPDPSPDVATQLEQKLLMEILWKEICQLPKKQRLAVLLNLRDKSNNDALILFTMLGVTNLSQIAQVLDFQLNAFTEVWNQLPLDDNKIAKSMGITRQQVINLRKSAKQRLVRRMASS